MEENKNIKDKVLSGAMWKFLERIIAQVVSLIVSIIIARLLDPSDYGVVSLVTVFFTFANLLVSGGLSTAIIQKKNADEDDYNTVFTVSFIMAVLIYIVLYFMAPWISKIYNQAILVNIIRVFGLSLPIYALKSIVCAYISSHLQFRTFFYSTLGGTIISAIVGISMAQNGYGAWALVAQHLTNTIIGTVILCYVTKLRLSFKIAADRFKSLFKYGYKILLSSLLGNTFSQINPLFVGLKYTSADLSFYTKGKSFPEIISTSMTYTISAVLFPALSKYQDNKELLHRYTRRYMQLTSFITFPVMLGFLAIAENFVKILLTEKWLPAVYYIQISCLSVMFDVIAVGNCETIKAMGRSDIFLKIEVIKKTGYFIIIGAFLLFSNSPQMLAISMLVCTMLQILVNSMPNRRLINYTAKQQLKDILPNLFTAVIMCICVLCIGMIDINAIALIILQIFSGFLIYLTLSFIINKKNLFFIIDIIKSKITHNKVNN